jgi:hypothetical protein
MHVLVAAKPTPAGPRDFCFAVPGELVMPPTIICADDRLHPDGAGPCGCGRAWAGLTSERATTAATVAELDLTRQDYIQAHADALHAGGWIATATLDDLPLDLWAFVISQAIDLLEVAAGYPVGTVFGRRLDDVILRPSA